MSLSAWWEEFQNINKALDASLALWLITWELGPSKFSCVVLSFFLVKEEDCDVMDMILTSHDVSSP